MAFLPAYAVDGGALPAQMLRLVAWASTSGATGIVQPRDLRIKALAVPGSQVRAMPGGALIATRYGTGSAQQTYAVANTAADGDAVLDIPATGSGGGRTDYIGYRIDDPQYGGQAPPDPLTAIYGRLVRVSSMSNLTYPFVPLAKIVIPASTATITQSMITDLREMANPRRQRDLRTYAITGETVEELSAAGEEGEMWPNVSYVVVDVPSWATRVRVVGTWAQVKLASGNVWGRIWVEYGPATGVGSNRTYATQKVRFDSPGGANTLRTNFICADDRPVPADIRGTTQTFIMKGVMDGHASTYTKAKLDAYSAIVMDLEFLERPAEDE